MERGKIISEALISKIATIEIPVSNIEQSVEWYVKTIGLHILHKDDTTAMLSFKKPGVPTIFLVETDDKQRLVFANTPWDIPQSSVIDLYSSDLEKVYDTLKAQNVELGPLNMNEDGFGGFGFEDLDGNVLSVCNIDHDAALS